MKTNRILIIVLSLVIVWLAYLAFFSSRKGADGKPVELWHTNTVAVWHTNNITAERWHTNTIELVRTNTILQPVTNEVIKEVAARLSEQERQAAIAGFRFLHAPTAVSGPAALYKASPIAVEVTIDESAKKLVADDKDAVRKRIEATLKAQNIPVAEKSPYRLSLAIEQLWSTDVPRVALLGLRLELRENAVLQRSGDVIQSAGEAWSSATPRLVRIPNASEELKTAVDEVVNKFCADYLKAKDNEKDLESRVPGIPADFLSGSR